MKNRFVALLWLLMGVSGTQAAPLSLTEDDDRNEVAGPVHPILTYHKAEVPPPPGELDLFRRSGFIHPLHAPNGEVVTGIHPADHIHHLGLWHEADG